MTVHCKICGEPFERIQWSHTWYMHSLSLDEYQDKFPESILVAEELKARVSLACEGNQNAVGSLSRLGQTNSEETKAKISKAQIDYWSKLSSEAYNKRLEDSFLSDSSIEKSKESNLKRLEALTYSERVALAEASFRSPEGIRNNLIAQSKKDVSGDRNPNWRGGMLDRDYRGFGAIRDLVLSRDHYSCRKCGCTANLAVHHILYDTLREDLDELVTLCAVCHGETNGNRDYWISFYSKLVRGELCPVLV